MKNGSLSFLMCLFFLVQFLFFGLPSHSRENYADPLHQFIPEKKLLAKFKIRSLVIYADISEQGVDKSLYVLSGKISEMEFDENGNLTYVLTERENSYSPFITYGNGCEITRYSYDYAQRLIMFYIENGTFQTTESMTYDTDGNLISLEIMRGKTIQMKEEYVWEKGKMIESKMTVSNEVNSATVNEYDESGRQVKRISDNRTLTCSRIFYKDSTETIFEFFTSDTLHTTQTYVTLTGINKLSHYTRRNHLGQIQTESKARYDEHGNLTYYYSHEINLSYPGAESYPPSIYNISNEYDDRGLIVKRLFYYSSEGVRKDVLIKVERMFYDSQQLLNKLEKGTISKSDDEPTTESPVEYACDGACESGND